MTLPACPYYAFAKHIQEHLKEGEVVICKICGKPLTDFTGADE